MTPRTLSDSSCATICWGTHPVSWKGYQTITSSMMGAHYTNRGKMCRLYKGGILAYDFHHLHTPIYSIKWTELQGNSFQSKLSRSFANQDKRS